MCLCAESLSRVWLFAALWTVARQAPLPMGILQARILEWVAISSSRESSRPRDQTRISYASCIGGWVLYQWCYLGSPLFRVQCQTSLSEHTCVCEIGRLLTY